MFKTNGLLHITISVTDVARATAFYQDILCMELYHQNPRGTMSFMRAGDTVVVLTQMPNHVPPNPEGLDRVTTKFHHALEVDHDEYDRALAHFAAKGIEVYHCTDVNHMAVPGFRHVYIKDPDGNAIEIAGKLPAEQGA